MTSSKNSDPHTGRLTRSIHGLPLVLLLIGALITWWLDAQQQQSQRALQSARFHASAEEVVSALERRLQSNVTILRGVSGLFLASDVVSRREFADYIANLSLDTEYSGIQGVGFAQWMPADAVDARQATVRAQGFPDFEVRPIEPARDHYSSIIYLEPFDWRNRRAFGYDMFSEPVRQAGMRRAVESGQPSLSGRITLLQETSQDVQAGFLIYLPIYKRDLPLETPEQRWQALSGWAYSPLRAGKLVESIMNTGHPVLSKQFGIEVFDDAQAIEENLLYRSPPPSQGAMATHESILQLFGAQWLVRVRGSTGPGPGAGQDIAHQTLLISGAALTILLALLAQVMLNNRQRMARAYRETVASNRRLEAQQAELQLAATVMESSPSGIMVMDTQRRLVSVNPAFAAITGMAMDDAIGCMFGQWDCAHGAGDVLAQAWAEAESRGRWSGERLVQRADGSSYHELLTLVRVTRTAGQAVHCIGLLQDVTQRRQQEEQIRKLALHDYLTGLGNRALLVDRVAQELQRAKRFGNRPAILFMDLDRFKPINDQYGHEAGDAVLVAVAQRLSAHVRETDLVCRQGGDEFIVLLPDHTDDQGLMLLATKLAAAVAEPIRYGEHMLSVDTSIGIATYPRNGDTVEQLVQSADLAMYRAKAQSGQRVWLAEAES